MRRFEDISDEDLLKVECACAEFEIELREKGRTDIEEVLKSVPRNLQACLFRELLATEIECHHLSNTVPSLQEYRDRFPDRKNDVETVYWETVQELSKTNEPQQENAASPNAIDNVANQSDSKDVAGDPAKSYESDAPSSSIKTSAGDRSLTQNMERDQTELAALSLGIRNPGNDTMMLADATVHDQKISDNESFVPVYGNDKRYHVEAEIDRGGMGVVLKVKDVHLNRTLAMKVVRGQESKGSTADKEPSADRLARFVREASITSRLDHPGVVPVHEMAQDDQGRLFFTMKMVQGKTLSQVAKEMRSGKSTTWTRARVLEVLVRVCDTLAFAHSHGVIHRDLKPANVMVGDYGEAYVMDWGLAKIIKGKKGDKNDQQANEDKAVSVIEGSGSDSSDSVGSLQNQYDHAGQTMDGSVMGTPHYMPPEQASGKLDELDERADIYSLGALLYEILTGKKPFAEHKNPVDVVMAVCSAPPIPIVEIDKKAPGELVAIAEKAMERNKSDRYQSVTDMAQDIRAFLDNRVVAAYRTGALAEFEKWIVRNRAIVATTLLLSFIGLAMIAYFQFDRSSMISDNNKALKGLNSQLETTNDKLETTNNKLASTNETLKQKNIDLDLAVKNLKGRSLVQSARKILESSGDTTLAAILTVQAFKEYEYDFKESRNTLYAAAARLAETHVLSGHVGVINQVEFSPDGSRIATSSFDGTCLIWDAKSGIPKTMIVNRQNDFVHNFTFSRDGKRILLGGQNGGLGIWNSETGERQFYLQLGTTNATHGFPPAVSKVFFLDDQKILAGLSNGDVYSVSSSTGEVEFFYEQNSKVSNTVANIKLSPDKKSIAIGFENGSTSLLQVLPDQFKPVFTSEALGNDVNVASISFSPNSKFVVTTIQNKAMSSQNSATIWDTSDGTKVSDIDIGDGIAAATYLDDNNEILLSVIKSGNNYLALWDVAKSKVLAKSVSTTKPVRFFAVSSDFGKMATVSGNADLHVWEIAHDENQKLFIDQLSEFKGHAETKKIVDVAFAPKGNRIVSGSRDRTARIWNLDESRPVPLLGKAAWLEGRFASYFVRWSPQGDRLLLLDKDKRAGTLWAYPDIRKVSQLDFNEDMQGVAYGKRSNWNFSRDGKTIFAAMDESEKLMAWSAEDGKFLYTIDGIGAGPYKEIKSNVDKTLVCVIAKDQTTLFDVRTRKPVYQFQQEAENHVFVSPMLDFIFTFKDVKLWKYDIESRTSKAVDFFTADPVALSPNGKWLMCKGDIIESSSTRFESYEYHVLDAATGELVFTISDESHPMRVPKEVLFSRDSNWLLVKYFKHPSRESNDDAFSVWSVKDRKKACDFGHDFSSTWGYSNDYSKLLIGSDKGIQLFDGHNGKVVSTIQPTFGRVKDAKFSSDNRFLILHETSNAKVENTLTPRAQTSLWDAKTGKNVCSLPPDGNQFVCGFTPNDKAFLTFNAGSNVQLWRLDMLPAVSQAIARDLNDAELNMYAVDSQKETDSQKDLNSKLATWMHRVDMIGKITSSKRNEAWRLIDQIQTILRAEPNADQLTKIKTTLLRMYEPGFGSDPALLEKMAAVFETLNDPDTAITLLEEALDHPRCAIEKSRLLKLRQQQLPKIASFSSAEWLAIGDDLSEEQQEGAPDWMQNHRPEMFAYYTAVKHADEKEYAKALSLLDSISVEEIYDTRPFSLWIECSVQLNQLEAAKKKLSQALKDPRFQNRVLVGEWLRLHFLTESVNFKKLVDSLPPSSKKWIDQNHLEDAKWLLRQLADKKTIRINCGANQNRVLNGQAWSKDRFYLSGFGFWESLGEGRSFAGKINDTEVDFVFQTERWFDKNLKSDRLGYRIPMPPGTYKVTLGFSEIYEDKRDFDVEVEGVKIVKNYDPANNQFATADTISKQITTDDGMLNFDFISHNSSNAKIASIEICRVD